MAAGGRILRAAALPAALLPLIPIAYLVVRAGGAGSDAWRDTLDAGLVEIATRSLLLSALVALGTVLVAVPYAFLVVRTDLPARRVWALVGALPLVVPSYVGAFALVGAFGPRGLLQGLLEPFGVERLPELYGFTGALVVLVLFTYPYVLLLVTSAWRRVDQSLERAARGMGQSPWGAFRHATLPQLRSTIVAGSLLSGLYALGDFGVVERVVAVGVVVQLRAQLGGSLGGAGHRSEKVRRHDSQVKRTGGVPAGSQPTGRGCRARRTGFPNRCRCCPSSRWTAAVRRRR